MLAPVALYPDDLLAQTLMAASYPLEVVEAARWSKDNPSLKGAAALAAVKDKGWDVSVTSLVAFPQVLAMMNSKLDWTQKIGDAMIAQQSDVAASIQRLRAQAQAAGNLKTTPQQTVTQQPASAGAPAGTPPAIVIQPTNPDTVYVPAYNPNWAYGSWPYPDYPPSYFPPTDYGWGGYYGGGGWSSGFSFGVGFAVGGAFFGGWNWGGGWGGGWGWRGWGGWGRNSYTTINVNRATYITNNFNRNYYHDDHWNHDPAHRHGVPYRDQASRERYDQHHPDAAQRQAFRGKLDHDGNRGADGRGAAGRPRHRESGKRESRHRESGQRESGQREPRRRESRQREPRRRRPARRIARQRLARQREPWRRPSQRLPRRQPRQRGASRIRSRPFLRPPCQLSSARGGGTAAVAMAADMEAGDERHNASRGLLAPVLVAALATRAAAQQAAKTQGFPTAEAAARALTEAVRKDDDKAVAAMLGEWWRVFVPNRSTISAGARALPRGLGREPQGQRRWRQGHRRGRQDRLDPADSHRQGRR